MPLHVSPAREADASRIATIHMAAFGSNPMLLAQFPSHQTRQKLQGCIAAKARADIRDPNIAVLVVRNDNDDDDDDDDDDRTKNKVISFAKWNLPNRETTAKEAPWVWPEGTDWEVLDRWSEVVESAQEMAVGGRSCYRLSFIATDPPHERRGAATLLLRWGLEHCVRDTVPAYLESTMDARPLYERLGFEVVRTISMPLHEQQQEQQQQQREMGGEKKKVVVYEEVCFIFEPSGATV